MTTPKPMVVAVGAGLFASLAMLLSGKHSDSMDGSGGRVDIVAAISLVVASCLVAFLIGSTTSEIPLSKEPRIKLGSPEYDMTPLNAPSASGGVLLVLAKIIGSSFGHVIARQLVNKNSPDSIRDLARQAAEQHIPVVSLPISRIDNKTVTDEMAATATKAIQEGLPRSYNNENDLYQVIGVLDYHQAYSSGKVTPSQMMNRVLEAMDKLKFLNMFMATNKDDVLEQARASDKRWQEKKPLSVFDGVPVSVKGKKMYSMPLLAYRSSF